MMRYRTVLFDMDGTLLDTLEDLRDSVNHMLEKYGQPLCTLDQTRRYVGNGARLLLRRAMGDALSPEQEDARLKEYQDWYLAHNCIRTHPYPGMAALLDTLRREGVRTAVVSNKPHANTVDLAARFFPGLPAFGQRPGIPPKPAPEMVWAALRELGAPRDEVALYVGDSEVDVQTAQNSGLDLIGVSWGFRGRALLRQAGAVRIADTAEELLALMR